MYARVLGGAEIKPPAQSYLPTLAHVFRIRREIFIFRVFTDMCFVLRMWHKFEPCRVRVRNDPLCPLSSKASSFIPFLPKKKNGNALHTIWRPATVQTNENNDDHTGGGLT